MEAETLRKQLDNDERFLNEVQDKLMHQMRRLKAEERALRQLLADSTAAGSLCSTAVARDQSTRDVAHIDEEHWINQIPLELNEGLHSQQRSSHCAPLDVNPEAGQGMQTAALVPAKLHDELEAARTVVQSILQEELGSDWMHDGSS